MAKWRHIWLRILLPAIFLFIFWIFITASFSPINILYGLICSCLTMIIIWLILRIGLPKDINLPFLTRLPIFLIVLAWQVIRANFVLALIVIKPRLKIDPVIVEFYTELTGDFKKTILASSITLTPGTLTIDAQDNDLTVHCLDISHRRGLFQRQSERRVAWLFNQKQRKSNHIERLIT